MKILFPLILAFGLAGCVTPYTAIFSPEQIILAGNTFDAVEATATNYLKLPVCISNGVFVCRTQAVSATLVKSVRNARHARSKLEAYVNANPGTPVPVNLFQAMSVAFTTLQAVLSKNNIN